MTITKQGRSAMESDDLKKYCDEALEKGAKHAKLIYPGSVVTAPWVRLKCQYGCPSGYNKCYCCPPDSPTPEQTIKILDTYHRAILFHMEAPRTPERRTQFKELSETLIKMEGDLFKEGYYKAFVYLAGACGRCKPCSRINGTPCTFPEKARPSMEAAGIDVFETARINGFFIQPLHEKMETQNVYCLMLVD
jgi:predicted metal-binding protein